MCQKDMYLYFLMTSLGGGQTGKLGGVMANLGCQPDIPGKRKCELRNASITWPVGMSGVISIANWKRRASPTVDSTPL